MFKFFKKIVSFLKLLLGNVDEWVSLHVQPSIEFVQRLKESLENPVTDILVHLIPSSIDDEIRNRLLAACNKALQLLSITADIANEPDAAQQLLKLLEYLKTATPTMRAAIYKQLSSEMAKASAGKDNVRGHSVDLLTQLQYSKMIEHSAVNDLEQTAFTQDDSDEVEDEIEAEDVQNCLDLSCAASRAKHLQ